MIISFCLVASSLLIGVLPNAVPWQHTSADQLSIFKRATPQAPNGYVPEAGDCPAERPRLRDASSLSDNENSWLPRRRSNTVGAMRELLGRLNIAGFDANDYIDTHANNASALPNIGIAVSGGGYRALMNGAGAIAAFDIRTSNSTSAGHLGGLLQSATYLTGLSGGGWLVGSLFVNNFTSVQDIINTNPSSSGSLWQFGNSIFQGPLSSQNEGASSAEYFAQIERRVNSKADAGFNRSITDYWANALSYQLINASQGGPGYTFSSIADDVEFSAANAPMPILVANNRDPDRIISSSNTTVFEFNPWEMGSFDPTVYGFAPLKYVGSNFSGGNLRDDQRCIRGFDNAGYIMGTSSSLFNQFLYNFNTSALPSFLQDALRRTLTRLGENNNDIADWKPNPFLGFNNATNPTADNQRLALVDGGEDLQNIPLNPLIQPLRNVDVIFAVDSSADTSFNWPNGTALVATYQRSLNTSLSNGTGFPAIPDQNTFVNLGLNTRPTFFGCDAGNVTGNAPLVVYIPHFPYIYQSNFSTFTPSYNNSERNAAIQNGYNVATMGNGTRDTQWPTCVGCAVLSRSFNRTGTEIPDACNQCYQRYCWDGRVNSTNPTEYNPSAVLTTLSLSAGVRNHAPLLVTCAITLASLFFF